MIGKTILVVEDESAIREMLRFGLERSGYQVMLAANAQDARRAMAQGTPNAILMDWMMPGLSGVDFARELRANASTRQIPIIMLTARAEEEDKIRGLNTGADDYVVKPFSFAELEARIQSVLRRSQPSGEMERLQRGGLVVDQAAQRVTGSNGQSVKLGPTEYRLLTFFMSHPERVFTREQVLDRVWGQSVYVEERTVDVHIRRLRKALEPVGCEHLVQTVRGTGYRFSEQPET